MPPVWITHLGHHEPGPPLAQDWFVEWLTPRLQPGTDPERLRRFAARSGVRQRHSVLDARSGEADEFYPLGGSPRAPHDRVSAIFDERACALAADAISAAAIDDLATVTHLVVATCTGAVAPGLDIRLAQALGLRADVRRLMIAFMGCYAAVPALRCARDICTADPAARVLVVSCELSSLHLEAGPSDDALIAATLFGDGAAAALVAASDDPPPRALRIAADTTRLIGDAAEAMAWRAGAHGFSIRLSPAIVPGLAGDLAPVVGELADAIETPLEWFVHPGGPRILRRCASDLALDDDAFAHSWRALERAGNRSSATVLSMLADAREEPWVGPGLVLAFGPGLTIEGLRLEPVDQAA